MFERIISLENLLSAWREFKRGKAQKQDVQEFELELEESLFEINRSLSERAYRPEPYVSFFVTDPKLRHIHKAGVRDRVVHQAIFRILYPLFDKTFIHDSYSCRVGKGTHRGVRQLKRYLAKATANYRRPAYALKCDIKKFFDSIDHGILLSLVRTQVNDKDVLWLLDKIVASFPHGLPLGNVTSQLFANVYLNELDQWAKRELKAKYYLRYCDDFLLLHRDRAYLESLVPQIAGFLADRLKLELHPKKVSIQKVSQGVDFLGYVVLPHAVVLRTRTKRRMLRRLAVDKSDSVKQSYLGLLSHANTFKLRKRVKAL